MNVKTVMKDLIRLSEEFEGVEHEVETDNTLCFYSIPQYEGSLKHSAIYGLHSELKGMDGLVIDISEAEESDDKRDLLYVQIEVEK